MVERRKDDDHRVRPAATDVTSTAQNIIPTGRTKATDTCSFGALILVFIKNLEKIFIAPKVR